MRRPSRFEDAAATPRSRRRRRRETAWRSRPRASIAPQSGRRSANSGRVTAPTIAISAIAARLAGRRTACRPRRAAPRHAETPRSPDRPSRRGRRGTASRPAALRGARGLQRESAAAADDGERARLAALAQASSSRPARGMQIARSPPSRRKATICCTAALSGKAAATSSTRSFSVPSAANSCL